MAWPAPSREAHDSFCLIEGWTEVRNATGKKVGHHITYELNVPDGRVLRTRVSKPPNKDTYGPALWNHILRDQLEVEEEAFWSCVHDGIKPPRGQAPVSVDAVPADLVHFLLVNLHLTENEIKAMSKSEAIERMTRFWTGETD